MSEKEKKSMEVIEEKFGITQEGERFIATGKSVIEYSPEAIIREDAGIRIQLAKLNTMIEQATIQRDSLLKNTAWGEAAARARKVLEARTANKNES